MKRKFMCKHCQGLVKKRIKYLKLLDKREGRDYIQTDRKHTIQQLEYLIEINTKKKEGE